MSRFRSVLPPVLVFAVLHHADHVLRGDHSGWPFTEAVTPFTFSLLVYPLLIPAFVLGRRYRIAATGVVASVITLAHILVEPPNQQFAAWADNSSVFPQAFGQPNLLNIQSPALAVAAVAISVSLTVLLWVAFVVAVRDRGIRRMAEKQKAGTRQQ
jgi:hypothetical protein